MFGHIFHQLNPATIGSSQPCTSPLQLNLTFSVGQVEDLHKHHINMENNKSCTETAQGKAQLLEPVKREKGAPVALGFSWGEKGEFSFPP